MIEKLIEDIKNAKIINQEMKNQILDQLQEFKTYKELEADGKLVKLPCKVGQILYYVNGPYILNAEVIEFWIDECGVWNILTNVYQNTDTYELQVNPENLGSTVFLTKEEAEEKLKKKELIKSLLIDSEVYYLDLLKKQIQEGTLHSLDIDEQLLFVQINNQIIQFNTADIGYILFLTREEAKTKLKNYTC